jgi:DNA replication protein DnaC
MRRTPATDLEPRCPMGLCDGGGWIVGEDGRATSCECREDRIRKIRAKGVSSVIPAKYRGAWFDRPPVTLIENRVAVREVRRYVERLEGNLDAGRGLWLMGDVGTGKTTLAMIVSKAALESGRTVAIYSLPDLLRRIRRTFNGEHGEQSHDQFFERLVSVDLLHLDDLGAEKASEWVMEELYSLINRRWEDERAVMVTTNLDQVELEDQIGRRSVSRLVEICGDPLPLFGEDLRYRPEGLSASPPRSGEPEAA